MGIFRRIPVYDPIIINGPPPGLAPFEGGLAQAEIAMAQEAEMAGLLLA